MTPEQAKVIYANVRKNHATLDACPRHDFSIDLTPDRPIGKRWRCANCGGEVDVMAKMWYKRGLEAGLG